MLTISRCGGRAWRTEVGTFQDQRGKWHTIGVRGMSDLIGLTSTGRALSVELKTGKASRSKEQFAWARMWMRLGGVYVCARYNENEDGDAAIAAALRDA